MAQLDDLRGFRRNRRFPAVQLLAGAIALLCTALHGGQAAAEEESSAPIAASDTALAFADDLMSKGEYYRAIGEYERFLFVCAACEDAPRALLAIAQCYEKGGAVDRALRGYDSVVEKHVGTSWAQQARQAKADALRRESRHAEAARAYEAVFEHANSDDAKQDAQWESLWSRIRARELEPVAHLIDHWPDGPYQSRVANLANGLKGLPDIPHRSPVLAGVLSGVLPGAGQAYTGRWRDAWSALLMNGLWLSGAILAFQQEWYAVGTLLSLGEAFWYVGNIYGAVTSAHRFNRVQVDRFYDTLETKYYSPQVSSRSVDRPWMAVVSVRF